MLCLIMLFIACSNNSPVEPVPVIENGMLDLTEWDFEKNGKLRINGDAEFYWNRLIYPEQFQNEELPEKTGYINTEAYWDDLKENNIIPDSKGYATYRFFIKLPQNITIKPALQIKCVYGTYKLWINSRLVMENDIEGTNPGAMYKYSPVYTEENLLEIIIHVLNSGNLPGGYIYKFYIGDETRLQQEFTESLLFYTFLLSYSLIT